MNINITIHLATLNHPRPSKVRPHKAFCCGHDCSLTDFSSWPIWSIWPHIQTGPNIQNPQNICTWSLEISNSDCLFDTDLGCCKDQKNLRFLQSFMKLKPLGNTVNWEVQASRALDYNKMPRKSARNWIAGWSSIKRDSSVISIYFNQHILQDVHPANLWSLWVSIFVSVFLRLVQKAQKHQRHSEKKNPNHSSCTETIPSAAWRDPPLETTPGGTSPAYPCLVERTF